MTVEQYAEFCDKHYKPDKDAKDLLLQAYKRGRAESLAEALKQYDAESVEDLIRNVREKTIDEIEDIVDEINNQGFHCIDDYCDDDNHDCAECMAKAILRVLERMKEGAE